MKKKNYLYYENGAGYWNQCPCSSLLEAGHPELKIQGLKYLETFFFLSSWEGKIMF